MTVNLSSPRAKPRWLILAFLVLGASALAVSLAAGHGASVIPARYAGGTQVDIDPPPAPAVNDQPSQVDLTQMGRDTSANPNVRIFWSWDAISAWTGKGQTGDACALFDNDNDGNINYVVCARVSNPNADPAMTTLLPAGTNKPVYLFDCTDARNDRCSQPTPRAYTAAQVVAGPLEATLNLTQSGAGNLQNETDPFAAGEANPHDTSLEIQVASALVPNNARLANVCSYPSAGNGGNNNPFDCIVTPGIQYGTLIVKKLVVNDSGGTKVATDFGFKVNGGTTTSFLQDPNDANTLKGQNTLTLQVGTYTVTEPAVTGYTTTTSNCTSVSVTAGGSATCTITNNDQQGTLIVKKLVVNDNGGTKGATDFSFQVNGATAVSFLQDPNDADTKKGQNTLTVSAGSYSITEPAVSGYATTYSNCTNVAVANGGSATCTITNNDQAGTLIVKKLVVNDNGGTKVATDFSFQVNGATAVSFLQDPNDADTKKGQNTLTVSAGSYSITEPAVSGYTTTYSNCTNVAVANGGTATCTITNNDDIAAPGIGSTLRWILHDSMALTSFVSGGNASTATFTLYKDTATQTSCEPATQIWTETVAVSDANGTAATATGKSVTASGTYRWIVTFNGNNFNLSTSTDCDDEVTNLP